MPVSKEEEESEWRSVGGKEFQTDGTTSEDDLSPTVFCVCLHKR